MNKPDNKHLYPAVPPLYPMDPCKKVPYIPDPILDEPYYGDCYSPGPIYHDPIYYEPYPIEEPIFYEPMPYDPYTYYPYDPYMECIRVCMRMRCGRHYTEDSE